MNLLAVSVNFSVPSVPSVLKPFGNTEGTEDTEKAKHQNWRVSASQLE